MDKAQILLEYFKTKNVVFGSIKSGAQISKLFDGLDKSIALQIVFDTSGSMRLRFNNMRKSLIQFIQFIESGVPFLKPGVKIYLNVVQFNSIVHQVFPATTWTSEGTIGFGFSEVAAGSAEVINKKFPKNANGSTLMEDALKMCNDKIWNNVPDDLEPFVILLTDGQPNSHTSTIEGTKKKIIETYAKKINLCVGIGSARDYDIEFLTGVSVRTPTIAVQTEEILDAIRESFLDITTENEPKDCVLMLNKTQVERPKSDGLEWSETDTHYKLYLGKITVAYQVLFSFKLKNPEDSVINHQFVFNMAEVPHIVDEPYPIKEPTELHINMYEMLCIKDAINQIDVQANVDENIRRLKELETNINIHALNDSLDPAIKEEWIDLVKIVRQKQNFLSMGDEDTYTLYSSTRTPSINTSVLRTLSSRPVEVDRNVTQAGKKVSYQCPLCIGTVEKPAVYKCGHMFCVDCALGYYVQKGTQCPMCKKEDMAQLGNVKLPIFPEGHDKSGSIMKCLNGHCKNRYHGYNYPCMHVSYCKPCGLQMKDNVCPIEGCGIKISDYRYYYTNYEVPTTV